MEPSIRVLLLDSDLRSRAAVTYLLAGDDIHVEPFEDVADLQLGRVTSGVILAHDQGDLLARLKSHMEAVETLLPVVAFSREPDVPKAVRAVREGAIDYLDFPNERDTVVSVLLAAQDRARPIMATHERKVAARQCVKRLTERERQVLTGVADGLSNRLIAEQLGISPRTVEIHRANMLSKMAANTSPEAVKIALYAGMWN